MPTRDISTKFVEPAWLTPFRKHAPTVLVLCVALLLVVAVVIPMARGDIATGGWLTMALLVLVFGALGALAVFLFVAARQVEKSEERGLAETRELHGLSERLNTTLRSMGEGVISTDVDGRVTLMNEAAVLLTGWSAAKALGVRASGVFQIVNEETRAPMEDPAAKVLASGKRIREDTHALLISRDGLEHPVAYNAAPILDEDGWIMGAVVIFHGTAELREAQRQREQLIVELSEANEKLKEEIRRREEARRAALSLMQDAQMAQAALKESNEALEEYARVASHDLQEPLRKIESFSQVLLEDYGSKVDEQGRQYLDIMVQSANRMRRLIRDVLAFSRAGTAEKPFEAVDLNHVLSIVRDNLSERIREKKAELALKPLPSVHADETQMIQLFQNLIGNGLKFNSKPKPRIEVHAEEDHGDWKVFVRDNGIGMQHAESRVIFAPFKRLHTQSEYEGTGIGLAICRRIVTRHGGTIGVESVPGEGSTFWFTLPKKKDSLSKESHRKGSALTRPKGESHEPSQR